MKYLAFALMFAAGVALARDWTAVSAGAGTGTLWSVDLRSVARVQSGTERLLVAAVQRLALDQTATEMPAMLPEAHCTAGRGQLTLGVASAVYTTGEETNVGRIAEAMCRVHLARTTSRK